MLSERGQRTKGTSPHSPTKRRPKEMRNGLSETRLRRLRWRGGAGGGFPQRPPSQGVGLRKLLRPSRACRRERGPLPLPPIGTVTAPSQRRGAGRPPTPLLNIQCSKFKNIHTSLSFSTIYFYIYIYIYFYILYNYNYTYIFILYIILYIYLYYI